MSSSSNRFETQTGLVRTNRPYSKLFKGCGHFSQTVRGQNVHKLSGDGHCDYRAHSESQPSASLSVDFLRVVQYCRRQTTYWVVLVSRLPFRNLLNLKYQKAWCRLNLPLILLLIHFTIFAYDHPSNANSQGLVLIPFEPAHGNMVLITRLRRACAVPPEPSLFVHMKYGSRQRVQPKIRHLVQLDACTCAFEE